MPTSLDEPTYRLCRCLFRREKDHYLAFFPDTEEFYVVNHTGYLILCRLSREVATVSRIASALVQRFDVEFGFAEVETSRFVEELVAVGLLKEETSTKRAMAGAQESFKNGVVKMRKRFARPTLETLSDAFEFAAQCKTFGMPKRSCKALPSGIWT